MKARQRRKLRQTAQRQRDAMARSEMREHDDAAVLAKRFDGIEPGPGYVDQDEDPEDTYDRALANIALAPRDV